MMAAMLAATESTIDPTLALILGAGMFAQWVAWRIQVPSIVALLLAGLLPGPVTGIVEFDELLGTTLFPLVSLAVALILFEGGLDLPPRELRNTGVVVRRLITFGAVVTFLVAWYGARGTFGISNQAAIVLGAVLVVTGPTVDEQIFLPLLRIADGKLSFLCRNDPLPPEGEVIGLASPSLQRQLDDDIAPVSA